MKYFNGFCLNNEEKFFKNYIENSDFYIYGFSYGAIKAFLYAKQMIKEHKRIDKLILFSPAFFQTKSEKFKQLQLKSFKIKKELYIKNFLKSCFLPYKEQNVNLTTQDINDLEELLYFVWNENELNEFILKGVSIEVYLGEFDKIIPANDAFEFFSKITDTTYIKKANHFLLTK